MHCLPMTWGLQGHWPPTGSQVGPVEPAISQEQGRAPSWYRATRERAEARQNSEELLGLQEKHLTFLTSASSKGTSKTFRSGQNKENGRRNTWFACLVLVVYYGKIHYGNVTGLCWIIVYHTTRECYFTF